MTNNLTKEQVLAALNKVQEPELHKDLVTLNMIRNLEVEGGKVSFTIMLTTPACPLVGQIKKDAEQAVMSVGGVESVEVKTDSDVPNDGRMRGLVSMPIRNAIAIGSGKGGVGKSTVSVNLAIALAKSGARVGLMDADIYGPNIPTMLGVEKLPPPTDKKLIPAIAYDIKMISMGLLVKPGQPLIWRGPMLNSAIRQFLSDVDWGELDYLIVDLPPGTGDVQLTLAQQASLTGAVIVTTPQQVALDVARRGLRMFTQVDVPIVGIIENMSGFVCSHCGQTTDIFATGGGRRMASTMGVPYLGSLPLDPEVMQSGEDGAPLLVRDAESPAARALLAVVERFQVEVAALAAEAAAGPRKVTTNEAGDVLIVWGDGHQGVHKPYNLRLNCPCAECVDEHTGARRLDPQRVPLDIKVQRAVPVGRYALAFDFSDGHQTGIYRFDLLRELCECESCRGGASHATEAFSV
jgi:ATP-binding protein involved in chromosome partitioning